jgi:uncharacterized protein
MGATPPPVLDIGVAADGSSLGQLAAMLNRHGLVTGATGTGKTVTLQVLAEGLSRLGVPVFAADIKGDLSGIADAGRLTPKFEERLHALGLEVPAFEGTPVTLWDLFGETGIPVRMTVSEMGPLLLARLLDLNDTQTGVLYATFRIADDNGLLLLDLPDLRAVLAWVGTNAASLKLEYGNLPATSIAAIQRSLLVLEEQGANAVFGEPALALSDLIATAADGRGVVNLLDATKLAAESPHLYACFLFWLLSELFEELPERGDADLPLLVLFFDEAHLLFKGAPKALVDKIEQVVRLIRSKGVGVVFVTQSPLDLPEAVLGQLGLKIQHALRAFTPRDQKAVRVIADTFRPRAGLDAAAAITELATGEALVSMLDAKGQPTPVARAMIRPPCSRIGPVTTERRQELLEASPLLARYAAAIDRDSAHEELTRRARRKSEAEESARMAEPVPEARQSRGGYQRQSTGEALVKSVARSVGSQIGSQIGRHVVRGLLGALFGKSR